MLILSLPITSVVPVPVEIQVPQGDGTIIGDMVNNGAGTINNAFNSNTNQSAAQSARKADFVGFVGKYWGSGTPKLLSRVTLWNPNNSTTDGRVPNNTVQLSLYGSNSSPASSTNGTLIESWSWTETAYNTSRDFTLTTPGSTSFEYHWLRMDNTGNNNSCYVTELYFYELV